MTYPTGMWSEDDLARAHRHGDSDAILAAHAAGRLAYIEASRVSGAKAKSKRLGDEPPPRGHVAMLAAKVAPPPTPRPPSRDGQVRRDDLAAMTAEQVTTAMESGALDDVLGVPRDDVERRAARGEPLSRADVDDLNRRGLSDVALAHAAQFVVDTEETQS